MNQTNKTPLPNSDIWFVRADEKKNALSEQFLENEVVSVGRLPFQSVDPGTPKNEIVSLLAAEYPNHKPRTLNTWATEIKQFIEEMAVGDAVATYSARHRQYHIGIIRSLLIADVWYPVPTDREAAAFGAFASFVLHDHFHRVEWLYRVSRDSLSESTRKGLSRPRTLYRLSAEASAELRGLCAR